MHYFRSYWLESGHWKEAAFDASWAAYARRHEHAPQAFFCNLKDAIGASRAKLRTARLRPLRPAPYAPCGRREHGGAYSWRWMGERREVLGQWANVCLGYAGRGSPVQRHASTIERSGIVLVSSRSPVPVAPASVPDAANRSNGQDGSDNWSRRKGCHGCCRHTVNGTNARYNCPSR